MMELGSNKKILLEQVRNIKDRTPKTELLAKLKDLLNYYSDLRIEDYKGVIDDDLFEDLVMSTQDPEEMALWKQISENNVPATEEIKADPNKSLVSIQNAMRLAADYERKYPQGYKIAEVKGMKSELNLKSEQCKAEILRMESIEKERADWASLNKEDYAAMQVYKRSHPNSAYLDDLESYMWKYTNDHLTTENLQQYCDDWQPLGKHVEKALDYKKAFEKWDYIWAKDDIIEIAKFMKDNPDLPLFDGVREKIDRLRSKELSKMKSNPSKYGKKEVDLFLEYRIFSKEQLIRLGLVTENSLEAMKTEKNILPDLKQFTSNPNLEAEDDCTDVFLFGTPGTGKTCLLMGLTGGDGQGYSINFRKYGGPYASALKRYVSAGTTPDRTPGSYVTTINGLIEEKAGKDKVLNHKINFVEMSGEEFAHKLANGESVKLEDMGSGTTKLLSNDNRKVFFIVVDPTAKNEIEFEYDEDIYDEEGNRIDVIQKKEHISQEECLNKFASLFDLPENKKLMQRVDAIHFIVTKADTLGDDPEERKQKAHDLLIEKYIGPIQKLVGYCRRTKRVNYSTNFKPRVYPFSLGKFYLGGVFEFDKQETLNIIDTLRHITVAQKEPNFWDRLRDFLA